MACLDLHLKISSYWSTLSANTTNTHISIITFENIAKFAFPIVVQSLQQRIDGAGYWHSECFGEPQGTFGPH